MTIRACFDKKGAVLQGLTEENGEEIRGYDQEVVF